MPRIPRVTARTRAGGPVNFGRATSGSELTGQALGELGQAVGQISDEIRRRARESEQRQDAIYAAKTVAEVRRRFTERAQTLKQDAEPGAPNLSDQLMKEYDTVVEQTVQQSPPDTREYLVSRLSNFGTSLHRDAIQFEQQSRLAKRQADLSDTIDTNTNVVLSDPSQFEAVLGETEGAIRAAGLNAEAERERLETARSAISYAHVAGRVEQNPAQTLNALNEGEFDSLLDPQDKASLMSRAQAAIKRRRAAARGRVRSQIDDHIASIQQTGSGIEGLSRQVQATMDPEDVEAFRKRERLAFRYHDAMQTIQFGTPEEMRQQLDALRPESGERNFADKQDTFEAVRRGAQQALSAREEDPAGYAMRAPEIRSLFGDNGLTETGVETRMDFQRDLGVPERNVRVLSRQEAQQNVEQIKSAPASQRSQMLLGLQERLGDQYDRAFGEMVDAGLDPETAVLATAAGDPALSQTLAQTIETGRSELSKGLDNTIVNDIEASVRDELTEFRQAFEAGDVTGGAADQANGIIGVTQSLALNYYRQTGDQTDAVTRAVNQIVLDRYHVENSDTLRAYVPKVQNGQRISLGQVEDYALAQQTREQIEAFNPRPIDAPDSQEFIDRERTIRTAVNSGYWVTNETGDGLVLMVPFRGGGALPLTNDRGERYEIEFTEAMNAGEGGAASGRTRERLDTGAGRALQGEAERREREFEELRERAR